MSTSTTSNHPDPSPSEVYVVVSEDGNPEIMEIGHIGQHNYKKMMFEFDTPRDITESLNKKNSPALSNVSVIKKGRTAYGAGKVIYPDGNETSNAVFLDCIIQYREGVTKSDKSRYGIDYICIGISNNIVSKIKSDASRNSQINLGLKQGVKTLEGYTWFTCSLEKTTDVTIIAGHGDEFASYQVEVNALLKAFKSSMKATVMTSISATASTESMSESIDISNGAFMLSFKPTKIVMETKSDKKGPVLEDVSRRTKESMTMTGSQIASDELAAYAMSKLSIT